MNYFDWILFGIAILSIVAGFSRGFVTEATSLVRWLVVFFAAVLLTPAIVEALPFGKMVNKTFYYWTVFVILVVLVYYLMLLVSEWMGSVFMTMRLLAADKFMGALFGLARGFIFAILFTLAFSYTSLPNSDTFKRSSLTYAPMSHIINTLFPKAPRL